MKMCLLKCIGPVAFLCIAISASADVCVDGTLASLISQPCTIANATFTFFTPDNLNAANVGVSILDGTTVGFTFTIPEQIGGPSPVQVIGFNVTTGVGPEITALSVALSSGFQGAVENACLGAGNNFNGFEPDGTVACLIDNQKLRMVAGFGSPFAQTAAAGRVTFATVSTGFIADGTANSVQLTETFTLAADATVPEPATMFLVGIGAFGCLRRKRNGQN